LAKLDQNQLQLTNVTDWIPFILLVPHPHPQPKKLSPLNKGQIHLESFYAVDTMLIYYPAGRNAFCLLYLQLTGDQQEETAF